MTGHGAAVVSERGVTADVAIRAVNARSLEVRVVAPAASAALEAEITDMVRERVQRGRVEVRLTLSGHHTHGPNDDALRALTDRLRAAMQACGIAGEPTLADVLAAGGAALLDASAAAPDPECARAAALLATGEALTALCAFREREGRALQVALDGSAEALGDVLAQLDALAGPEREALRSRALARVTALVGDAVSPDRLAAEVAVLAERGDVTEELVRAREHLRELRRVVHEAPAGAGRTLEFIAQELHRELNTCGAKSVSPAMSRLVIEGKGHIERIREQAQNVE